MSGNNDETAARRFLVMGCCSILLHVIIAAIIILPGIGSEKSARVYNVEVKYLQAEVEKSSGYALLDEAALATVERWRFKPAMKGRETVICWVNIPIRFTLN